jgi:hypothetical protein
MTPETTGRLSPAYDGLASICAILAGLVGLVYAVSFVLLRAPVAFSTALLVGGLLTAVALVALYGRLRAVDAGFAGLALVFGLAGALGAAVHGGYDLANALNPIVPVGDLPNAVDPRGLLTFGVAGLGLLLAGWLITRVGTLPRALGYLGYVTGALFVLLYLARLIVLNPASPLVLAPAALAGFIGAPAFYLWLGWALRR